MRPTQRLASRQLSEALGPLNARQAALNLERLRLVRGFLLPELQVDGEVPGEGGGDRVMMVAENGRFVRAWLYSDISNGGDGGFNAPYDLNGDGQVCVSTHTHTHTCERQFVGLILALT